MRIFLIFLVWAQALIFLSNSTEAQTFVGECEIEGATNIGMNKNPNFVFISVDRNRIVAVDVSNPANPFVADSLQFNTGAIDYIFIRDNSAYLTGIASDVNIVDISDPYDMRLITEWQPDGNPDHCTYVRHNIAYVTTCYRMLVVDVTNEYYPEVIRTFSHCGDGYGICAEEGYLYIADMNNGLQIFDITDAADPVLLSSTPICQYATFYSSAYNHHIYLPSADRGITIVDASDPLNPIVDIIVGSINYISSTYILNYYLFVVGAGDHEFEPHGLFIYDISVPDDPMLVGYYEGWFSGVWATEGFVYLVSGGLVILSFDATSNDRGEVLIPNNTTVLTSYPNPFNAQTTIRYSLPESGPVSLTIYNILGQKVATLLDGVQAAGEHRTVWDANGLPSGIYLCRLHTNGYANSEQLFLMK